MQDSITVTLPDFDSPWTIKWVVFAFIVIVGFAFTARTALYGNVLIVATLILLAALGWFVVSPVATIAAGVIGILGLIAISSLFKKGA